MILLRIARRLKYPRPTMTVSHLGKVVCQIPLERRVKGLRRRGKVVLAFNF